MLRLSCNRAGLPCLSNIRPIGIAIGVIVKTKMIMQALWQLQITWDEEVPKELRDHWLQFAGKIDVIIQMKIKRQVLVEQAEVIELHGYSDASEKTYGVHTFKMQRWKSSVQSNMCEIESSTTEKSETT